MVGACGYPVRWQRAAPIPLRLFWPEEGVWCWPVSSSPYWPHIPVQGAGQQRHLALRTQTPVTAWACHSCRDWPTASSQLDSSFSCPRKSFFLFYSFLIPNKMTQPCSWTFSWVTNRGWNITAWSNHAGLVGNNKKTPINLQRSQCKINTAFQNADGQKDNVHTQYLNFSPK